MEKHRAKKLLEINRSIVYYKDDLDDMGNKMMHIAALMRFGVHTLPDSFVDRIHTVITKLCNFNVKNKEFIELQTDLVSVLYDADKLFSKE